MHQTQIVAVVAVCGALGALARYGSVQGVTYLLGDRDDFPYGTLLVNVLGCFAIGIAAAALVDPHAKTAQTLWLRYGLMVGFLGAYTTFSAFSLDTLKQLQDGQPQWALVNVVANCVICLVAVWAGLRLGEIVF